MSVSEVKLVCKRSCILSFVHRWVGFEHENFRGRQYLWDMSERGEYNCYDKWCAQVDHVSSVRSVKQVKQEVTLLMVVTGGDVTAAASETLKSHEKSPLNLQDELFSLIFYRKICNKKVLKP